jgi:hypothetical protein
MVLIKEVIDGVLTRYEGGTINNSKKLPLPVNQRILHSGKLLIQSNLVFIEVLAANEPSLVIGLFGRSLGVETSDLAPFYAVLSDVVERCTATVNQDY